MYTFVQTSEGGDRVYSCARNLPDDYDEDVEESCPGKMEISSSSPLVVSRIPHNHSADSKECRIQENTHLVRIRLELHVLSSNHSPYLAFKEFRKSLILECSLDADLLPRYEDMKESLELLRRNKMHDISAKQREKRTDDSQTPETNEAPSVSVSIDLSANGQPAISNVMQSSRRTSASFDPYRFPDDIPAGRQNKKHSNRRSRMATPSDTRNAGDENQEDNVDQSLCSRNRGESLPETPSHNCQTVWSSPSVCSPWTNTGSPAAINNHTQHSWVPSPFPVASPVQSFVSSRCRSVERALESGCGKRENQSSESPSASSPPYRNIRAFSPISCPPSEIGDINDEDLPLDTLVTNASPDLPELSPADVLAGLEETDSRPESSLASFSELLKHLSVPAPVRHSKHQYSEYNIANTGTSTVDPSLNDACKKSSDREMTVLSCVNCRRQVELLDKATEAAILLNEPARSGTGPRSIVPQFAVPFTPPAVSGTDHRTDVQKTCRDLEATLNKLLTHLDAEPDAEPEDDIDNQNIVTQCLTGLITKARNFLDSQAQPQPKIVACTPRYAVVFDSDYSYSF